MSRKLALIVLAVWLAAGTVAGGVLLLRHAALRVPASTSATLRTAVSRALPPSGRWGMVHVMYRECTCSTKTIVHLIGRRALPGIDELVLVVDDGGVSSPEDQRLRDAGFGVGVITPSVLRDTYAITAAPVLVVARPDRELAYVGGYNRHKQEPRFMDVAIVRDAMHDATVSPLPVFGCLTVSP
ncbi:MAG: hypothetical protein AB7T06_47795 [Kofleriaceae bacterium]